MREYIVLVSKEHYNPLGIVRTLGEAGIRPIVVAVRGELKFVGQSRYVKKRHYVDTPEEGLRLILSTYPGTPAEKHFILTGDDVTVSLLDAHYDELKDGYLFYNAGEAGRLRYFLNKDHMCELAVRHGFSIPKTWKIRNGEIPSDLEYPVITKALHSFGKEWKDIVFICRNEDELKAAYRSITSPELLLQKYIRKTDEQSYEGFCVNHGREAFFSVQNNEVYHLPDKYSPYWSNKNVDDPDFIKRASGMLEEMRLEGIFEFEFMVGEDGTLYFLEINLRNTANGWTTTVAGMPSVTLWCESMLLGRLVEGCYREIPAGFRTMAECFDYDVRVKGGMISRREWRRQYRAANAKLYKGRHDNRPFFRFMWYKLTKMKKTKKKH